MKHDQFIGQVQHRARLSSRGEAERATAATLATLAARLEHGLAHHIAAQLPPEIGDHLRTKEPFSRFSLDGFFLRASLHERADLTKAASHAKVVMEVLCEALSPTMVDKMRSDLPKQFHVLLDRASTSDGKRKNYAIHVSEVMTRGAQVVAPDCPIQEVADKMRGINTGCMPVCDGTRLVGVVTDRDIAVRAVADGHAPSSTNASRIMTPQVIYCFEDDDIENAVQIMERHQIRRLVVLDRQKRLVGILSLGDIAQQLEGKKDMLTAEALERISDRGRFATSDIPSIH